MGEDNKEEELGLGTKKEIVEQSTQVPVPEQPKELPNDIPTFETPDYSEPLFKKRSISVFSWISSGIFILAGIMETIINLQIKNADPLLIFIGIILIVLGSGFLVVQFVRNRIYHT